MGRAAPGGPAVPGPPGPAESQSGLPPEWPWRFSSLSHKRLIIAGVGASLWLPQDLGSWALQTCPLPSSFAGGCEDQEAWKVGKREHPRNVPLAS